VVVALIVTVTSSAVAVGDLFGRGRSGRRTGMLVLYPEPCGNMCTVNAPGSNT